MTGEKAKEKYNELFNSIESKAEAFDKLAEKFYYLNFGSASKTDIEVLMFSIYIDRILKNDSSDFSKYSDYMLSKQLGITQAKVSNLKVRKELIYPTENFDWKKAFLNVCENAVIENNTVVLFIPDKNIYIEVKNAIETTGGFVEVQLTPNLLKVRLPYFLDLMLAISDKESRSDIRNKIKKKIEEDQRDMTIIEKQPLGRSLKDKAPDLIIEIIGECIPFFGGTIKTIMKTLYDALKS